MFDEFDKLIQNENNIELLKNSKLYLSVYHECSVRKLSLEKNLEITLQKVEDIYQNLKSPAKNSFVVMTFFNVKLHSLQTTNQGNFEDFEELIFVKEMNGRQTYNVVAANLMVNFECDSLKFKIFDEATK